MQAAYFGYVDIVRLLLRSGSHVDQYDSHKKTPLYVAAYHGRTDIVDLLIQNGADIDHTDKNGKTPLYIAVLNGHLTIAEKLLLAGIQFHFLSIQLQLQCEYVHL